MLKYAMKIDTLTEIEKVIIDRFISFCSDIRHIESIYLFGSRSRGVGHAGSDIDIAVIVKNRKVIKEITQTLIDLSIMIEEELEVSGELMINPIAIDETLLKANIGIGKSVGKEGILLWSKKLAKQKRKVI